MGPAPTMTRVMAVAMIVAPMAGSSSSRAAMPTIVSSTNRTAANGVLYAAANPAAVPAATSTRV
ncbi:hypothetical protein D3C83_98680 [compost metagenome]